MTNTTIYIFSDTFKKIFVNMLYASVSINILTSVLYFYREEDQLLMIGCEVFAVKTTVTAVSINVEIMVYVRMHYN